MSSSDEDFRLTGTLDLMNDLQEKSFRLDDDGAQVKQARS
jgi:hypothetical protein